MNDTSLAMHQKQLEIILSKTLEERFMMGFEMIEFVLEMLRRSVKSRNPEISDLELKIAVFRQFYRDDFQESEMQKIIESFRNSQ